MIGEWFQVLQKHQLKQICSEEGLSVDLLTTEQLIILLGVSEKKDVSSKWVIRKRLTDGTVVWFKKIYSIMGLFYFSRMNHGVYLRYDTRDMLSIDYMREIIIGSDMNSI